ERPGAGPGHVVVVDVGNGTDGGMANAAQPGPDLLHDRRLGVGHHHVVVGAVGNVGAVLRHHAQAGLARFGHDDVAEAVVGEVSAGLRADHQPVAALGGQVRVVDHNVAAV